MTSWLTRNIDRSSCAASCVRVVLGCAEVMGVVPNKTCCGQTLQLSFVCKQNCELRNRLLPGNVLANAHDIYKLPFDWAQTRCTLRQSNIAPDMCLVKWPPFPKTPSMHGIYYFGSTVLRYYYRFWAIWGQERRAACSLSLWASSWSVADAVDSVMEATSQASCQAYQPGHQT